MKKFVFAVLLGGCMTLGITPDAAAKKGFYLGAGIPYNTIKGDFEGNSDLLGNNEIIILPEMDGALGLNIMIGYGINAKWAVEANFLGSTHDGHRIGWAGDVDHFSFSINGKYNFLSSKATQPYLLFGISSSFLVIHDGSRDLSTGEVDDAMLSGTGFNLGGGIERYLGNASVRLGLTCRFVEYTDAEGVHDSGSIDDPLNGSGITLMVSTAYHF